MTGWNWNGSRWWKFDFHSHTPASDDYGKGADQAQLGRRTPREWLLDYMRAGIDCVAITDHNSGAWVDKLKTALEELEAEKPDEFRTIHLFPGVEISVHGGVHLLAVLECDKTTSDIDSLLGAAGFPGKKGVSDAETTKSFAEVAGAIKAAGGIAIPAHVDEYKGLFNLDETTLEQALDCGHVFAMEIVDSASRKPQLYTDKKIAWTEVLGSDAHHPSGEAGRRFPGSHFTWVKMGSPSLEGLRLALLDGQLSVRRCDDQAIGDDPNERALLVLESVEIEKALYMGHTEPFKLKLNPWLNAIVGGRGTGKSTLVEFLRLALRRDGELPEDLAEEFRKYKTIYANRRDVGLLRDDTNIRVVYRKNGSRFRVQWSPTGNLDPIEENIDGGWKRTEGDIPKRFPVRIYSQKQIFHLAKTPLALLGVVDDDPAVDRHSWKDRWTEEESRFLSLRAKAREIEAGLREEPRLRGDLDDVKRRLAIFEEADHAAVLKAFQSRTRQHRALEAWEEGWASVGDRLRDVAVEIVPDTLDEETFDLDSGEDAQLHEDTSMARDRLDGIRRGLEDLAKLADDAHAEWQTRRASSDWKKAVDAAQQAYEGLRERLAEEGAGDPAAYGELVQRRQTIEQRLRALGERKTQVAELHKQAEASLQRLLEIRRELTKSRTTFLDGVLKDSRHVRIRVVPYEARETVEDECRRLLQTGSRFEKAIGRPGGEGLLGTIYKDGGTPREIEQAVEKVKQKIRQTASGSYDQGMGKRFATHLRNLQPEVLDRFDLWFPEDSLDVRYSPTGDGQGFRPIQEGSPGQKTAALLAFLLSYGKEPLILDQPEDDLDNALIYDLIVTQLREVKRRRQIIVVTHNANIVVNGDAELVVALAARGGETQKDCEGSLQEKQVRDTICKITEGGRDAFEQRYRRIALEGRNV